MRASTAPRKRVYRICERRPDRCKAPRRGDAGTSLRSVNEADGRPPPQRLDTLFRGAVLSTLHFGAVSPMIPRLQRGINFAKCGENSSAHDLTISPSLASFTAFGCEFSVAI